MKKAVLLFMLVLSLAGCGTASARTISSYTDENGNFVYESDSRKDVHISALPCEVPYNSKHFTLLSVDFYENKVSHSYNLFAIVTLDVGELSDDECHWLAQEDLNANVYVTNEKNELDFDGLSYLGIARWIPVLISAVSFPGSASSISHHSGLFRFP